MLTDGGRLDVLRALAAVAQLPRTIVLAERIGQEELIDVLRLGVRGVVLREAATSALYDSIRGVLRDEYALGPPQVSDLVRALAGSAGPSASGRNPFRSISEETVKRHLSSIFDKLGVFSRLELAIFALNHGLIDGESS